MLRNLVLFALVAATSTHCGSDDSAARGPGKDGETDPDAATHQDAGSNVADGGDDGDGGGPTGGAPSACAVSARAIPEDAVFVPVADRGSLQALLDAHRNVVLAPGDYSTGGPAQVQLTSGHGIYAAGRSQLPKIIVPAGTTGATVSGTNGEIEFAAGSQVTRDNCFQHVSGGLMATGASLVHNEFVDIYQAKSSFDTSAGGYLRNNRFVRLQFHTGGDFVFRLVGDAAHDSYGNVIFWLNALSAPKDTIVVEHQRDFTIVGADAENYGTPAAGAKAMYYTRDIDSLRIHTASGRVITPAYDLGAKELYLWNAFTSTSSSSPNFTLQPDVDRAALLFAPSPDVDLATSPAVRFTGFGTPPTAMLNGSAVTSAMAAPFDTTVREILAPSRPGQVWARPVLLPIPDPAGPSWNVDLASKPDDAPALQALIDSQHVVQLEPRTYYLGSALRLGAEDGLIGHGMDKTVLVAKVATNDLLTTKLPTGGVFKPVLVDLTLQGGRNGLNMNQLDTQMTVAHLNHVTFREMSNAGINGDHIYGVDNNMFSYLNFYRCGSGFKMRTASGPGDDSTPDLGYVDKTIFYRNQFVECGTGVDIVGRRANNLNAWFESSFRGSTSKAFHSEPDAGTLMASCELIDNHGDPVIDSSVALINSYFRADANATSLLQFNMSIEGSVFERGTSTTATLFNPRSLHDPRDAMTIDMQNSRSELPLGALDTQPVIVFLSNNELTAGEPLFRSPMMLFAYDTKGTPATGDDSRAVYDLLPPGPVTPGSRLLFQAP